LVRELEDLVVPDLCDSPLREQQAAQPQMLPCPICFCKGGVGRFSNAVMDERVAPPLPEQEPRAFGLLQGGMEPLALTDSGADQGKRFAVEHALENSGLGADP
jgi:hypothetical protein